MSLFEKIAPYALKAASDAQYSVLDFLYHQHRWPDLHSPQSLNEKILWLNLNYRNPLVAQCTDKLQVRDYVRSVASDSVLVPLLGVYERAEDIPFGTLPDRLILKATHGSGWNVICRSRSSFRAAEAATLLAGYLQRNFHDCGREWMYKDIPARILCEALLLDAEGNIPADYKVFCFHGKPRFVQVDYDRFGSHTRNLYDLSWQQIPCRYGLPNNPHAGPHPPEALDEMLALASCLAEPFPLVRVDMYALGKHIYFGELSFSPVRATGRFRPRLHDRLFGEYLDLKPLMR